MKIKRFRKIEELNNKELEKVYYNNDDIIEQSYVYYCDDKLCYVDDIIFSLKDGLKEWYIGYNTYNFIEIKSRRSFIDALIDTQIEYSIIPMGDIELIDLLDEKIETLYFMSYNNKQYDNLSQWIDIKIEILIDDILKTFDDILEYPSDDIIILNNFIECYSYYLCNNCYVDNNYNLYRDNFITLN